MKKPCKMICINVLWRMKEISSIDKDYRDWVSELKGRFRQSQIKAAVRVNSEMLRFYWSLGQDIVERQMENIYGSGFFSRLSKDLQQELPDTKGFSPTNIKYFKYFYELYSTLLSSTGAKEIHRKRYSMLGKQGKIVGVEQFCATFLTPISTTEKEKQ